MSASAQVSVRVQIGRERAFAVFTEELGDWWRPHALFATTLGAPGSLRLADPGPGGRLLETLTDGRELELGRVTAWEPPGRLCFGWAPESFTSEEATEVEVTFTAIGDATRVTVTHRGWESVPRRHVARHRFPDAALLMRLAEWWTAQLERYTSRFSRA